MLKTAVSDVPSALATATTAMVATASLVLLLALNSGVAQEIAKYVAQWDLDSVLVMGTAPTGNPKEGVWTEATIDNIRSGLVGRGELAVYKFVSVPGATSGSNYFEPVVMATDASLLRIKKKRLAAGFYYTGNERDDERYCIIGPAIRAVLFPAGECVGKEIKLGDVPFVVRGVFAPQRADGVPSQEDAELWLPLSTAKRYFAVGNTYRMLLVRALPPNKIHPLSGEVTALLRKEHQIDVSQKDDFRLTFPDEIQSVYEKTTATAHRTALVVALTAILLGGLITSAASILSIGRRRKEIALKIALGASRRRIWSEMIIGTLLLGLLGGGAGILLGVAAVHWAPRLFPNAPFVLSWPLAVLSLSSVAGLLGLLTTIVVVLRVDANTHSRSPASGT
ncbi:MAG TPA: ABC transporter permease [Candidatus Polarisedimenticolaceae bacterium]|nr:ABC transporter permease [Candidatus Polarisedimenticolaceae bacterium]